MFKFHIYTEKMKSTQVNLLLVAYCLIALICICSIRATAENEASVNHDFEVEKGLPKIFRFDQFKKIFKKSYSTLIEELARKKIFLGRAFRAFLSVIKFRRSKSSTYLKISEMSDWTIAEFRSSLLQASSEDTNLEFAAGREKPGSKESLLDKLPLSSVEVAQEKLDVQKESARELNLIDNSSLQDEGLDGEAQKMLDFEPIQEKADSSTANEISPNNPHAHRVDIDHRESNCLGPVKAQGICGSCYIFATNSLYEWKFCKETGEKISLSEQYVIDCASGKPGLAGCAGGDKYKLAEFYEKFGLELGYNYPYSGRESLCPHNQFNENQAMGCLRLKPGYGALTILFPGNIDMVLVDQPVVVTVSINNDFIEYGGGVDTGENCSPQQRHAMLLIGTGSYNGEEYFLFRNSYGPSWGYQGGHYMLRKDARHCILSGGVFKYPAAKVFDQPK